MKLTKNNDNDKKLSEEIKLVNNAHNDWHATNNVLHENHSKLFDRVHSKEFSKITPEEKKSLHGLFENSISSIKSHHESYAHLPKLSGWAKQEIKDRHNNWLATKEKLLKDFEEKKAFSKFFQNNFNNVSILDVDKPRHIIDESSPPVLAAREAEKKYKEHNSSLPTLPKDHSLIRNKKTWEVLGVGNMPPPELQRWHTEIPEELLPQRPQRIRPLTAEQHKALKNRTDAQNTQDYHNLGDKPRTQQLQENKKAVSRYSEVVNRLIEINGKLRERGITDEARNALHAQIPALEQEYNELKAHPAVQDSINTSGQEQWNRFGGRNLGKSNMYNNQGARMIFKDRKHFEESLIKSVKSDIKRFILNNGLSKSDMSSKINQHADWHKKQNDLKEALMSASKESANNAQNAAHPSHSKKEYLKEQIRNHLTAKKDLPYIPGIERTSFMFPKPGEYGLPESRRAEIEEAIKRKNSKTGSTMTGELPNDPDTQNLRTPKTLSSRESARQYESGRISEDDESGHGLPNIGGDKDLTQIYGNQNKNIAHRFTTDPNNDPEYPIDGENKPEDEDEYNT